eukprot:s1218_g4.t1
MLENGGEAEAEVEEELLVPLHSDFVAVGFQPYVLDVTAAGLAGEEPVFTTALIVMMRQHGLLLALPELALQAEVLIAGNASEAGELVGPSAKVETRMVAMDEDAMQLSEEPADGQLLTVLLVDFSREIVPFLQPATSVLDLTDVIPFNLPEDHLFPMPADLVERALAWAGGAVDGGSDRLQYYSADDVPTTPVAPAPKRTARRKAPGVGTGGGGDPEKAQKKRPTVAQLSETLESVAAALPGITSKLQAISERQDAMEAGLSSGRSERQSALRRPLSSSTMLGSQNASTPAQLVKEMPPPRGSSAPLKPARVTFGQNDTEEMALDLQPEGATYAQALMEQAKAMTALVAQLSASSSDPLQDLGSTSSSLSSKGALGRAKLQAELAAHKGVFFVSVLQSMARRMQPALSAEVEMSALRDRGITPTQYLERFGGFGRTKDLGMIAWQVALAMNHMQEENFLAAKDAISLLFVCLEQAAMDGGSLQVGLLLSLTEDPPQTLFSNRSLAMGTLPRPFAPTANQRWVTTALQYLKEMDVISTRRAEVTHPKGQGGDQSGGTAASNANQPSTKKKPKSKGGGKSKANQAGNQTTEEEQTFHIAPTGSCPDSAVFPIPAPRLGLFSGQDVPKLAAKKWKRPCRHRILHVIVMALNYIHSGMQHVSVTLLARKPNHVHLAIYRRIGSLLTACDRPDSFPIPPGRSGPEFIARLVELEHFASSHEALNPNSYAGESESGPASQLRAGEISDAHRFKADERFSPIHPYRSLDASRLKLTGSGSWPLDHFLEDILWLPYLEPSILLHKQQQTWQGPDFKREEKEANYALAQLWSAKGLLALFHERHPTGFSCRVFNAHKNSEIDRQIGDRRHMNGAEMHPKGPSAYLPSGQNIASISCKRSAKLVGCASDRKDFYHQSKVSRERAFSNQLFFPFKPEEFAGTTALEVLYAEIGRPHDPIADGDRYGKQPRPILCPEDVTEVYAGFNSLFQGDHLGVEYALASHCNMLKEGGLLDPETFIERHRVFPRGSLWQGVVIDDYFVVSRECVTTCNSSAKSVECLSKAEAIYSKHGVIGSDEKTLRGLENFKIVGAEIFSDSKARDAGAITVGAPLSKRIPLICLSLKIAASPYITRALASRVSGNWVSVFMYRRPLSCILAEVFAFGSRNAEDEDEVLWLPRKVAEEFVLASIFGLVAVSDISAPYDEEIYATDASLQKGAVTAAEVGPEISEILWLGGDKKGAYTLLDNPARSQLRTLGCDVDDAPVAEDFPSPQKAIDFAFDAVEICGGSGVLSDALAAQGLRVCTPIDISNSKHYDLTNIKLVDWIFQMIFEKRFKSVVCEPVCTTFSPAQHPASRSYQEPLGFDRTCPKTLLGNMLAFRCLAILWFALRHDAVGLLEQPQLSKMAWLTIWIFLRHLGCEEAIVNSCAFGSIHKKPFRFLGCGVDMKSLARPCPGGHSHVRIEGKLTKASAVYHPNLAKHLALHIAQALERKSRATEKEPLRLESIINNDILVSAPWRVCLDWRWVTKAHINVLENRALTALHKQLLLDGGDRRFYAMLDSRVAKGAHAKGRSSAVSLRPSLMRSCAFAIAGNLHPSYGFSPTRINTADAPTRERPLPVPSDHSIIDFLSSSQIAELHAHQFSKATAGWIRLYILAVFCFCPGGACWICNLPSQASFGFSIVNFWIFHIFSRWTFAYLLTLWIFSWFVLLGYNSPKKFRVVLVLGVALASLSCGAAAMPLSVSGGGDAQRAARRAGTILQADRVILPQTRQRREQLLQQFDNWLSENWRTTLNELIGGREPNFEDICEAVIAYGKDLFHSGKSYGRFSETINAITARRPILRKNVGSAWDLAFNWVVDEPHEHHAALPASILIAVVALALLWGWAKEAALLALAWTGVLRIGEVFAATRADLILPEDAAPGVWFAILKIQLPKTRGRAARHQSSRIDPADIVELLTIVFARLNPSEKLWPWSPATLRKKFKQLQSSLGVVRSDGAEQYTLSSLRPGGATYWLQCTEDSEFVRRKGRWLSGKVLEIYLQEAEVATYQDRLSFETKSRITSLCNQFPSILRKTKFFRDNQIPEKAWPQLWIWVCGGFDGQQSLSLSSIECFDPHRGIWRRLRSMLSRRAGAACEWITQRPLSAVSSTSAVATMVHRILQIANASTPLKEVCGSCFLPCLADADTAPVLHPDRFQVDPQLRKSAQSCGWDIVKKSNLQRLLAQSNGLEELAAIFREFQPIRRWPAASHATAWHRVAKHARARQPKSIGSPGSSGQLKSLIKQLAEALPELHHIDARGSSNILYSWALLRYTEGRTLIVYTSLHSVQGMKDAAVPYASW